MTALVQHGIMAWANRRDYAPAVEYQPCRLPRRQPDRASMQLAMAGSTETSSWLAREFAKAEEPVAE
jgi:hypothetical protein